MRTGDAYLNNLFEDYKKELVKQKAELKSMPKGTLILRKEKGSTSYVQLIPSSATPTGKQLRKGITKNEALLQKMARKKYLEISTKLLEEEVINLNKYLRKRLEPSPENVLSLLPDHYKTLPEKMFFPQKRNADKWASADYRRNGKNPEQLTHISAKGLRVRSKSELIIAEMLDRYGIPYRYEQVIRIGRHFFSPDFIIWTENGLIYWEHCGMMAKPDYREYNKWKLSVYDNTGIVPWKNLIITYDNEDGDLDARIIDAEIKNKLLDGSLMGA